MPRLVLAILFAGSTLYYGWHAFAMGGGGGRHNSGGGSGPSSYGPTTTTYYASDRPVFTAPEPGTLVLLGTGAGAVGVLAWLRGDRSNRASRGSHVNAIVGKVPGWLDSL